MKKLILIIALVLLLISSASAILLNNRFNNPTTHGIGHYPALARQDIYIDSSATGDEDGSIDKPYNAFSDINWTTGGDNSVFDLVAAGIKPYINLQGTFDERLQIAASGTVSARITIQSYGTGAIINVADTIYSQISAAEDYDYLTINKISFQGTPRYYSIRFLDNDHIIVKNCIFTDSKSIMWLGNTASFYNNTFIRNRDGSANSVIHVVANSNSNSDDMLSIYNNTFTDCYTTGVYETDGHMIGLGGGSVALRSIKHARIFNNTITGSGSQSGKCAIMAYNAEDIKIYNNSITDGYQGGISVGTNCKNVEVTYNLVSGNLINASASSGVGGIIVEQASGGYATGYTLEDIIIAHNTITNNDDTNSPTLYRDGIRIFSANYATFVVNNITVKNNVVHENFTSVTTHYHGHEFNLYHLGLPTFTNIDIDNNNYYRTSNTDYFLNWEATEYTVAEWNDYQTDSSQDADTIITDPDLTAEGKLNEGSPALNTGIVIEDINDNNELDIWGNATDDTPNIGAYQGAGEVSKTYMETARTDYWATTRTALWDTPRNTEVE